MRVSRRFCAATSFGLRRRFHQKGGYLRVALTQPRDVGQGDLRALLDLGQRPRCAVARLAISAAF